MPAPETEFAPCPLALYVRLNHGNMMSQEGRETSRSLPLVIRVRDSFLESYWATLNQTYPFIQISKVILCLLREKTNKQQQQQNVGGKAKFVQ